MHTTSEVFNMPGRVMVFDDPHSGTVVAVFEPDGDAAEVRAMMMEAELCHELSAEAGCTFGQYMRWRHEIAPACLGGLRYRDGLRMKCFRALVRGLRVVDCSSNNGGR